MDLRGVKEFIKDTIGYAILIIVIILLAIYVVGFGQVVGDSMNPSFNNSDFIILDKITYRFKEPKRGDVIYFYYDDAKFLIKRIIGLPGDEIEIEDGILYINNKEYKEDYLNDVTMEDYTFEGKIPKDKYFVLGDNRDNSKDSRDEEVGLVDKSHITGKVKIKLWPIKDFKWYK